MPVTNNNVKYECRFAVYVEPPADNMPDLHVVKLIKHENGTKTPVLKLLKDFQRPFWTVRKGQRNFEQHKEWIEKEKLVESKAPQHKLVDSAARALNMPWFAKANLRKISESPYLFGTDILSTAVIKKAYADKYPDVQTGFSVAVADTETDVVNGTNDILMMSITHKTRVFTAVTKDFISTVPNFIQKFNDAMYKYLGDIIRERNIKFEIVIVDNAAEVVKACLRVAHELKPDLLAFWNIDFDITKILDACTKYGIDPKDIFSDPEIPKDYRYFRYKQGPKKKVTASGKVTPIKPAAQWHTVYSTSSFYMVDAMCIYKHVRVGKQEEQSYSLDNILNKNLGIRKLKFEQADHVTGLKWHKLMQTTFKVEYVVYNVFDCISIEMLDEKTTDMSLTFPLFSGFSDFENFKSQPRRAVDKLHYFCLENDRVISATKPSTKQDDDDDEDGEDGENKVKLETLGLEGWITTLPAHLVADNGLQCIEENPSLRTNIRAHTGDLDVSASYPNGGAVFNVSKETTRKEMGRIKGIDEYTQRMQGINLISGGHVNSVEYCINMFNFPTLSDMLKTFEKTINTNTSS